MGQQILLEKRSENLQGLPLAARHDAGPRHAAAEEHGPQERGLAAAGACNDVTHPSCDVQARDLAPIWLGGTRVSLSGMAYPACFCDLHLLCQLSDLEDLLCGPVVGFMV